MHFHVFRINFLAQGNMAQRRVRDNDLIKCPRGRGQVARESPSCRYMYIEGSIRQRRIKFIRSLREMESGLKY